MASGGMSAFTTYVVPINKVIGINITVFTNYRLETRNKDPRGKKVSC